MTIVGAHRLSEEEIALQLTEGYRLVSYEYCLSFIVVTLKRPTELTLLAPHDSDWGNRILFSTLSFFFGWWGIPWGPIYTVGAIYRNLSGGHDHSQALIDRVLAQSPSGPPPLPYTKQVVTDSGKTPGIAIASLVLGLLSLAFIGFFASVPAIICGHLALIRIKKTQTRKGRGLALTGLILGYVVTLLYAALFIYIIHGAFETAP